MQQVRAVRVSNGSFRRPLARQAKLGQPPIPKLTAPTGPPEDGSHGDGKSLVLQIDERLCMVDDVRDGGENRRPFRFARDGMLRTGRERICGVRGTMRPALARHVTTAIPLARRVPRNAGYRVKDEIALKHAPPGIDVEDVPGDERAEGSPEDAIVPHPAYAMKQMIVAQQLFKEPRQLLRRDRPHLEQTAEQRIGDLVADFAVRRVESGEQAIEQFDGAFVIRLTQQGIVTSGEIAQGLDLGRPPFSG